MITALPPKPLPKRTYVTLASALTSLVYDRAFELKDLLSWRRAAGMSEDDLREALTKEWLELADYACKGTIVIRGRRAGSSRERQLREDDLRNCRYVGWWSRADQSLSVDPFPFTYDGGFKSSVERDLRGFIDIVVSRADVLAYKKVRPRLGDPATANSWSAAETWLRELFESVEPIPGLRDSAVARMVAEFGITKSRARELWTSTATKLKWPLHGRPSALQKQKLESLKKEGRV